MPEGPRCELRIVSFAARPFGHAAKKFRTARFNHMVLNKRGFGRSIFDLQLAKLAFYFLSPIGVIIMLAGMAAAFRTPNGSVRD